MPLRGGHGVILFIALIERRYVLFMEKTSENTVQVWKNKKIKHWMLIAFFLCFFDIVAVNLSYIFGLFIRFDLTFSAIPTVWNMVVTIEAKNILDSSPMLANLHKLL